MGADPIAARRRELEPQPIVERGDVDVREHASLFVEDEPVAAGAGPQVLDVGGDQAVQEPVPVAAAQLEPRCPRQIQDRAAIAQSGELGSRIAVIGGYRDPVLVHEPRAQPLMQIVERQPLEVHRDIFERVTAAV